ncbi:MAG: hypothetical protein K0S53_2567 [Bacteroidetes bacterium]|jgi:hypothetical protein|nr:hypothetical protein [Bacteroidota bacterium]MDF2453777.1 hypothetical protein [Bacteroidota bacterium]
MPQLLIITFKRLLVAKFVFLPIFEWKKSEIMKNKFLIACLMLGLASCGNDENSRKGPDKTDETPYKNTNDERVPERPTKQGNTSEKRVDSLGQN